MLERFLVAPISMKRGSIDETITKKFFMNVVA
jgi:hypothetical protein